MTSFGEELKRERELREISLREIAERTKINLRYLEALEVNQFEHLPGGVYNRNFVRAYSECIGVDPEPMVNAYLLEERAQQGKQSRDKTLRRPAPEDRPTRGASFPPQQRVAGSLLRWVLLLVLLAALIGGVFWMIKLVSAIRPATEQGAVKNDLTEKGAFRG